MFPLILAAGIVGTLYLATRPTPPQAFISFAAEDARIRDLLIGQSKHPDAIWTVRDRSLHEPFSKAWKTQTKEIISKSDVVVVLIGGRTHLAEGVEWEIKTAIKQEIPIFGVIINKKFSKNVPEILKPYVVIQWNQQALKEQLDEAMNR